MPDYYIVLGTNRFSLGKQAFASLPERGLCPNPSLFTNGWKEVEKTSQNLTG